MLAKCTRMCKPSQQQCLPRALLGKQRTARVVMQQICTLQGYCSSLIVSWHCVQIVAQRVYRNALFAVSGFTFSAIGDLKVLEVSKEGHFIRVMNASSQRCEEFGGYVLQQNVMGKMVWHFRFPPFTKFPANSIITVWANGSKEYFSSSVSELNFVCTEDITKWGCGPEFTTILCKPNGQVKSFRF